MKPKVKTELIPFQRESVERMDTFEKKYDGGFLLTEPGLGKTLTILEFILERKGLNLVVCPAGVLDNWKDEIEKHTENCRVYIYYGARRDQYDLVQLKKCNVILTTYTTLTRDIHKSIFKKEESTIIFTRIILDEAHYIRNYNSGISQGLIELSEVFYNAKKWIVTATPFFNTYMDFYPYFRFLGLEGVDSKSSFNQVVNNELLGLKKLNKLVAKYSIKYKKEEVLKDLKKKNEQIVPIKFSEIEREFYNSLRQYSLTRIAKLVQQNKQFRQFKDMTNVRMLLRSNMLTLILRLKQSCNSPLLTVANMKRFDGVASVKQLNIEMRKLQENVEEDCPICYDVIADTIAEPCGHMLCKNCWGKLFERGVRKCPVCRTNVVEIKNPKDKTKDIEDTDNGIFLSSKMKMCLAIIREKLKRGEKVIVVSQWVKFLDIIRTVFDKYKLKYVSLQGNMPIKTRMQTIKSFESNPDIKICCVSLLSSAEGINLVSANNMILVDNWWNNAKITQVMDRIHRIGQKKDVNIYKLQVENSIEEKIMQLVDKKHRIGNLITGKWSHSKGDSGDWLKSIITLVVHEQKNS